MELLVCPCKLKSYFSLAGTEETDDATGGTC